MIKKKLIAIGVATTFAFTASSVFADLPAPGLKLKTDKSEPHAVNVNCNGIPLLPIPGNGGHLGPYPYAKFAIFGKTLKCTFTESGTNNPVGSATLTISGGNQLGEITAYKPDNGFSVDINPVAATTNPVPGIEVTLSKKR